MGSYHGWRLAPPLQQAIAPSALEGLYKA